MRLKSVFLLVFTVVYAMLAQSQIVITPGVSNAALISNLAGQGISISNISMHCNTAAYGTFTNGAASSIGLNNGLLLTTGGATLAADTNSSNGQTDCWDDTLVDADLSTLEPLAIIDPCIIEFDMVPQCNQLTIRYVFGSEEYPEYVSSGYNDAFGFFITGPNPLGGNYSSLNIAQLPNGTIASIDNINNVTNSAFYVNNANSTTIEYDGLTTQINSTVNLIPCLSYHFKLAIADAGDCAYDSGVFIDFLECTAATTLALTSTTATCGSSNGTATAIVSNATPPITYVWNPAPPVGQGTASASGLSEGSVYTLTVNDASTCNQGPVSTVTIGGTALTSVNALANVSVCAGATVAIPAFTSPVAGTTYVWNNSTTAVGLGASGNGNIASFTANNSGNTPLISTITVVPYFAGCAGVPTIFTITVNPIPQANTVAGATYCNGDNTGITSFAANVPGTLYNWTCSNTSIASLNPSGNPLPANGTGFIPDLTVFNPGNAPVQATFTISPIANGCAGVAVNYVITVNPDAIPNPLATIHVCAGDTIHVPAFSANIPGVIFSWLNPKPSIGLAAGGTGNIPAFTAINTTNGTITVKINYRAAPCSSTTAQLTLIIEPALVMNPPSSILVCEGAQVAASNFTSNATGSTFTWTNSTASIGLPLSGTGNFTAFTAQNNSSQNLVSTVTVHAQTALCSSAAVNYTITVKPTPLLNIPSSIVTCAGSSVTAATLSSTPSGASFTWTNSNSNIGLAASGNASLPNFIASNTTTAALVSTISSTPTLNGCTGAPGNFTITVNPTPLAVVPTALSVCNGDSLSPISFSSTPSGASFNWTNTQTSIGLASNGTGAIAAFTATNASSALQTATVSVSPVLAGCVGPTNNFTIAVKPSPTVLPPAAVSICSGAITPITSFTSSPLGATFLWNNSDTTIGLTSSGIGSVPSFTAINVDTVAIVSSITVTPVLNACLGAAQTYSISVKPLPVLSVPLNELVCAGTTMPATNLISVPQGASFAWNNSSTAIGLAASGNGNVPQFVAQNSGSTLLSATITVFPNLASCIGNTVSYNIDVKPSPQIIAPQNKSVCSGDTLSAVNLTSSPLGAQFSWTNSDTTIGLSSNGMGLVPSFVAVNAGNSVLTSTISIQPELNSCTGNAVNYTVQVKPIPSFVAPPNQIICEGAFVPALPLISNPPGANFTWLNNNTSIGLGASGAVTIPSFTAVNNTASSTAAAVTIDLTLAGCKGIAQGYALTIHPKPVVNAVANHSVCDSASMPATIFTSTPAGATFNWTNSNTNIGLGSTGIGDIASFTAHNSTTVTLTSNLTVTPILNGCTGLAQNFTYQVRPLPQVFVPQNSIACDATLLATPVFSSIPSGASYSWSNTNTSIGLAAAGTGNIPVFLSTNSDTLVQLASITAIPTLNGCVGKAQSFSITIQPKAKVIAPADISTCADEPIPPQLAQVIPTAATLTWTNSNSAIGLTLSGNGNIPGFIAKNNTGNSSVGVITIRPSFGSCPGIDTSFKITVLPRPKADFTYTPNPATILNSTIFFEQRSLYANNYQWDFGDANKSTIANPEHTYLDTACYPVELIASNDDGCIDTAYHLVCINGDFVVYIPNAFTPDGDGINEVFLPRGFGISNSNYEFEIFDRWGLLIFKSVDPQKGWDGRTSNLMLKGNSQIDTYVYKLHCEDNLRKGHDFTGQVTLYK